MILQRRQEARRNGFVPCIQYPEPKAASSTTTASSHLTAEKEAEEGAAAVTAAAGVAANGKLAPSEENGDEDKVIQFLMRTQWLGGQQFHVCYG